ncbi:iron-sulfur cluster biosynthesis family protein [Candidatus Thiodictyon syntrophicum]|jgi:iron-sulfur cluster assembly protein|uniref:Iron-sulfur cluster assembly accessory protein n=1 Tax=Candidatus Thiodictyon syntrophicum TaxID=1166950 RepID=A0A2K8UCY3_9GAMM|nr:iron-sulfur cluster biosynthesis family protein [Candidatus Thiodictyon syntrophicum]AUB83440.1 iron-sulfur cluster assembly accessory protein [Candidatus Thiodictyon syntrophicum]
MFTLTKAAAAQVQAAAQQGEAEGLALRLAAQRQPDGAFDYRIGFDEATEDDIRIKCGAIEVVMTPEQVPLLNQATMDYVELAPGQFHFIFLNPQDPSYQPPTED